MRNLLPLYAGGVAQAGFFLATSGRRVGEEGVAAFALAPPPFPAARRLVVYRRGSVQTFLDAGRDVTSAAFQKVRGGAYKSAAGGRRRASIERIGAGGGPAAKVRLGAAP